MLQYLLNFNSSNQTPAAPDFSYSALACFDSALGQPQTNSEYDAWMGYELKCYYLLVRFNFLSDEPRQRRGDYGPVCITYTPSPSLNKIHFRNCLKPNKLYI
jgi:hypothetical protein